MAIKKSKLLDKINANLSATGMPLRSTDARLWLRNNLKSLVVDQRAMLKDRKRMATRIFPGKMYFFNYDPKLKETLPYYDRFPLVIPIERYPDGFLGINLHYLPIKYRIILLDKLYNTLNNEKYDETTKLRINYTLLSGTSRFKEFQPCLKRYLSSHLKSRLVEIEPNSWETAIFLPVERFVGKNAAAVQRESVRDISHYNQSDENEENK